MLIESDIEELRQEIDTLLKQADKLIAERNNYRKQVYDLHDKVDELHEIIVDKRKENKTLRKNVADLTEQHYASLKRIKDLVDANAPKIEKEHKTK